MVVSILQNIVQVSTLPVDAKIWEWTWLRVHPAVRNYICVGMAQHVLSEHINAMAKMNPPKLTMCFLVWRNFTIVGEGHLTKLIQAMNFVLDIERSDKCFFTEAEIFIWVTNGGFRIFPEGNNIIVGNRKGIKFFEGFPDFLSIGVANLFAAPRWILPWPQSSIDLYEVGVDRSGLYYRR